MPILLTVDRGGPDEASVETGADGMYGGAGDDTLFGGPSDRTVNYGLDTGQRAPGQAEANGADVFSGGDGQDHVSYVNREIPVSVTLDGRPNDGASGERDDVAPDVERLTGGSGADDVSGGPGSQALDGGPGSDTLTGLDGADAIEGGTGDDGADNLAGGGGPDTLSGGPGGDSLSGGDDGDALGGGGGTDRLSGDGGPTTNSTVRLTRTSSWAAPVRMSSTAVRAWISPTTPPPPPLTSRYRSTVSAMTASAARTGFCRSRTCAVARERTRSSATRR